MKDKEAIHVGDWVRWMDGERFTWTTYVDTASRVTNAGTVFVRRKRPDGETYEIRCPKSVRLASENEIARALWLRNKPNRLHDGVQITGGGRWDVGYRVRVEATLGANEDGAFLMDSIQAALAWLREEPRGAARE